MVDPKDNEWLDKFKENLAGFSLLDFKAAMDYINFYIEALQKARVLLEEEYDKRNKQK